MKLMKASLWSIEDLFDYFCWSGLIEIVGSVRSIQESHHSVPVDYSVVFFEEFTA
jgi:hypothetical protein